MATFDRHCEQCGDPFTTSSAQKRFCGDTCRSRAHRGKPALTAVPDDTAGDSTGADPQPAAPTEPTYDTLEEQVRSSLNEAKALDTIAGMTAVRIAQQIDRGRDSGSAVATLSKELSRQVEAAKVEAAPRQKDGADDIFARASEKILRLVP